MLAAGFCAAAEAQTPAQAQSTVAAVQGAQVYVQSRCAICHGGLGGGGLGPRLAGDPMLTIGQFVIARILIGRDEMPAFADTLSDTEIAAVADYIRNKWGNNFGPVTPQNVAEVRGLMNKASQVSSRATHPQN